MVNFFIDAGHGGSDSGAIANGLREKDITLAISLLLRKVLDDKYTGHKIKLSRDSDKTLSLNERTTIANNWRADLLLSVHINAGGGTGFESFIYNGIYTNKAKTNRYRQFIHCETVKATGFRDRGKKTANFHMLRESLMPAILTENGFIDHISDSNNLKLGVFLNKIAYGHAVGLAKAFHLKKKRSGKQPNRNMHTIEAGDTLWSIAKQYDSSVNKLIGWNSGVDPYRLQIGQEIGIEQRFQYHTIQKGNTLWGLARKYNTTVALLLNLNKGLDPERLQIGQNVRIR